MKKVLISLLLFFIFVLTFLGVGPFLTLYSLKESIEEKDSTKLSQNIYFPELRANLKDQINLSFSNSINKRLNDKRCHCFSCYSSASFNFPPSATVKNWILKGCKAN